MTRLLITVLFVSNKVSTTDASGHASLTGPQTVYSGHRSGTNVHEGTSCIVMVVNEHVDLHCDFVRPISGANRSHSVEL